MKAFDILQIQKTLISYGHEQGELEHLKEKQILEIYEKETRERIEAAKENIAQAIGIGTHEASSFIAANADAKPTSQEIRAELDARLNGRDPENPSVINPANKENLLEILIDMLFRTDYSDLKNALAAVVRASVTFSPQKVLDLAFREFQELLLYDISRLLEDIPKEEFKVMMDSYEKSRNDIEKLREAIKVLSSAERREEIVRMTRLKNSIVRAHMPGKLQDVYREFYNSTPEKIALIDEVLSYTNVYSKEYLKNMYMSDLEAMRDEIREKKEAQEREERLFNRYAHAIEGAFYNGDDGVFKEMCYEALRNLSNYQVVQLGDRFKTNNSFLASKFGAACKEFKALYQ